MEQSRTTEQKLWESHESYLEGFDPDSVIFAKAFYGTLALPFRIPTVMRGLAEKTSLLDKISVNSAESFVTGVTTAAVTLTAAALYMLHQLDNQDYLPLAIEAAIPFITNTASEIYETIRTHKKTERSS